MVGRLTTQKIVQGELLASSLLQGLEMEAARVRKS